MPIPVVEETEGGMAEHEVLIGDDEPQPPRPKPNPSAGWRWLAWFGLVLALTGLGDIGLAWIPLRVGNAQWEFGTVAATVQGFPLVAIGIGALVASAVALGTRWLIVLMDVVLIVAAVALGGVLVLFLTDVPLALRATRGAASLEIKKVIVKTLLLGGAFGAMAVTAAVALYRQLRQRASA